MRVTAFGPVTTERWPLALLPLEVREVVLVGPATYTALASVEDVARQAARGIPSECSLRALAGPQGS